MILGVKEQYPKANQSVIQKAEYEKKNLIVVRKVEKRKLSIQDPKIKKFIQKFKAIIFKKIKKEVLP